MRGKSNISEVKQTATLSFERRNDKRKEIQNFLQSSFPNMKVEFEEGSFWLVEEGEDKARLTFTKEEKYPHFNLAAIDVFDKSQGLGTEIVYKLKELADQRKANFSVNMIINEGFFNTDRFPFFEDDFGELIYRYKSQ